MAPMVVLLNLVFSFFFRHPFFHQSRKMSSPLNIKSDKDIPDINAQCDINIITTANIGSIKTTGRITILKTNGRIGHLKSGGDITVIASGSNFLSGVSSGMVVQLSIVDC